ncbi:MAG: OmpA family protein [Gemmatimonadaceae bacterium]
MRAHLVAVIPALAAIALTSSTARAQRAGNVEVGGFGQYSFMDSKWALKDGVGFGGRLGVYLTPRWELEADLASTSLKVKAPAVGSNVQYLTYAGRLVYGIPVGGNAFLLEAGAGGDRVSSTTKFAVSPGIGYRWNLNKVVSLRFDGLADIVTTSPTTTNAELRAGLSFRLGHQEPPPPPVPVINQDSINQARRRDSIAAADAARAQAQQDSINAAARARQDSIAAAARARQDSIAAADRARAEETARVTAELETMIYFPFNQATLRDDAKAALDAKLPIMQANPDLRIRIEGNADERGSAAYNMALGMRRAQQARRYLVSKGIDATRIDLVSNGEEHPVCTEHAESCWSQNRRDAFVIVAGGDTLKAGN